MWPSRRRFPLYSTRLKEAKDQIAHLKSETYLKSVSLNKLGDEIENGLTLAAQGSLHSTLHLIYSNAAKTRCKAENKAYPFKCADLTDVNSNAQNPYFWKLHGLVDSVIGDWLKVHGYSKASETCPKNDPKCYSWKGTFLGQYPFSQSQ